MAGLAAALIVSVATPADAARRNVAAPAYDPPSAAIVVDVNTGRTLFAENADAPRIPASITKVMTLYLLFEQLESGHYKLGTNLKVTKYAASQPPSKLGVRAGATITVENAIKALITRSANDVAVVVAENIAGTEAEFARMMTAKARALGMSKTSFRNPHGLPANPPNITTARDLSVLGRAIQDRFPRYYAYFGTRSFNYAGQSIGNHNRLLGRVEGVDGIKTGYTRASGFNLLTSMRADGRHVVATVLGGRSGAQRDRRMEQILSQTLPQAHSGRRRTPFVVEAPSARAPELRVAATPPEAPRRTVFVPPSQPLSDTVPLAIGKPVDLSNIRPVVASADAATATPSSGAQVRSTTNALAYAEAPVPAPRPDTSILTASVPAPVARVAAATAAAPQPQIAVAAAPRAAAGASGWIIQLGASADEDKAHHLLQQARSRASDLLANASPFTEKVVRGNVTLFRARFSGFDPEGAQAACKSLKRSGFDCFATKS
ncbi:serine hydrolase [Pseudochelatococcus contaminans]|uniref:D-alanyl-D-alanine carboxypeptidase n=1 Tax=Pseudochelatococcus contaminans TaxID=1538103 RepID=A0A7W5Z223_9HYPH|nr:serine hydrolase [Pseudochelatococcus contaminans]MBB3808660.1 D-alanyl-D-alanine carboxypeptidase [Pseudochelatococcus contaminans]